MIQYINIFLIEYIHFIGYSYYKHKSATKMTFHLNTQKNLLHS